MSFPLQARQFSQNQNNSKCKYEYGVMAGWNFNTGFYSFIWKDLV